MAGEAAATVSASLAARQNMPVALVLACRPQQWVKNALVLAAPLAAGVLSERSVAIATGVTFVLFCASASAVYLVNDVFDVAADRQHPTKRLRPVASGALPVRWALTSAVFLFTASLAGAARLDLDLLGAIGTYIAVSLGYCFGLKHQRVLDMAIVSSGFLLRAIAGGAAADLPLSRWFLIVAAFGSLFVVAGKRYSELVSLGDEQASLTRRSLVGYSQSYLRFVWSVAAGVAITAYCLWAFEVDDRPGELPWGPLSIGPFVLAVLRYALDVDEGRAAEPEAAVLRDPLLLTLGLAWLILFALGAFRV